MVTATVRSLYLKTAVGWTAATVSVGADVSITMVWQWLYNEDYGLINAFLGQLGLYQPPWLTSEKWAMPSVIIMSIWKNLGFNAVILLAGVQGISSEIYESAERLCENLESVGVDVSRIRKLSGVSTGIAVIGVIPEGDNSILVIPGANAHVDKSYIMENMDLLEASDIIVVQLEIPLETVMYAVKEARKRGKTVILDPAPAVSDLPDELFACVDVIKPNETELAILLQECSDEENLCTNAKLLQQKGVKNIVVTLGGEGSYLLKEDHTEKRLHADKTVHVVDTTAAGDSYVAGLAVALARGDSLDEAVELAGRVSNIVVTRKGAQTSIPSFEELEEAPE